MPRGGCAGHVRARSVLAASSEFTAFSGSINVLPPIFSPTFIDTAPDCNDNRRGLASRRCARCGTPLIFGWDATEHWCMGNTGWVARRSSEYLISVMGGGLHFAYKHSCNKSQQPSPCHSSPLTRIAHPSEPSRLSAQARLRCEHPRRTWAANVSCGRMPRYREARIAAS